MKRVKKTYGKNEKEFIPSDSPYEKRQISEKLKMDGYEHSFSPVYSRQYPYKHKSVTPMKEYNHIDKEDIMDEIYQAIEERIKKSGFQEKVSGYHIYNEISDLIDNKDNGTYILMSKPYDDIVFEYCVDVMADNFNLSYINIITTKEQFHIDFDHD